MNWIRANKFLTGFIAVMVVGVGALGYLLYSSWNTYNDVTDQYTEQANALHQLQSRVPYPDEDNLAKYQQEKGAMVDATHALATQLSKMVLPIEDMTPSDFQDHLRVTAQAVNADAEKAHVKLPAKFALNFDQYQTSPPTDAAAAPLGRQLAALKIAMEILINEHVDEVTGLTRATLPQEGAAGGGGRAGGGGGFGGGGGGGGGRGGRGGRGGGGFGGGGGGLGTASGGGGLVETYPFEVRFTASQPAFQKVLNDFAASKEQFFITRNLVIENTNPKPVARDDSAATAPPPATTGTDNGSAPGPELTFIVGTEKVAVVMRVDMVAFNPPAGSTTGRGNGGGR
jgi:hypothetical protein